MKKKGLKIWKRLYASSMYRGLSFVFESVGLRKASNVCFDMSAIMEYKERFGFGVERIYYKFCGGAYIIFPIYTISSLFFKEDVQLVFPIVVTILNFVWCFLMASMDLDKMFARHLSTAIKFNSSFLHRSSPTIEELESALNDPRLVFDVDNQTLRYELKDVEAYLNLLYRTGSEPIIKAFKAFEQKNIPLFGEFVYESSPEIYKELHTRYDPLFAQREMTIYFIDKDIYAHYIYLWINALDVHPEQLREESVGTLCVTESGQIVENFKKEDEE